MKTKKSEKEPKEIHDHFGWHEFSEEEEEVKNETEEEEERCFGNHKSESILEG